MKRIERIRNVLRRKWVIIAVVLALAVVALALARASSGGRGEQTVYHAAQRGDFLVSIVEGGTLKAVNDIKIRSEVEGTARIINIVDEGTYVQAGDLLVELDSAEIRDRLNQQEITFENNRSSFIQAREALAIQRSQSESTIKEAELKLEFAKSDLEKFVEGEGPLQLETARNRIRLIEEEKKRAQDRHDWTERLHEKGFATRTELEADELSVTRRDIELRQANEDERLLITYDQPNRLRQLESNVEQAKMELERALHRAASQIAQAEADLRSRESTLRIAESKLEQLRDQLEKTKIFAPQDGLVVYAFGSSYSSSSSTLIEEGAQIRQRQEIIQLPDISQMMLDIKVHESHVSQVRPGQRAFVTIDSIPDQVFRGRVRRVSLLPDTQSRWGNPNLKVYTTEILIEDRLPNINPGVSARAEVIITNLTDVVTVPIQAVTTQRGRQVAHVVQGRGTTTPVPVEVGLYNDRFIEIRSGLRAGDRVLLSPPITRDSHDLLGSPMATRRGESPDAVAGDRGGAPSVPAPSEAAPGANGEREIAGNGGQETQEAAERRRSRLREELEGLSQEDREARIREMRERRGQRSERDRNETEARN